MVGCLLNQNARRCQLIPVPTLTNTRPAGLDLLKGRRYDFDVERAVYLTVLHRLFASGSDRAADRWRENYR